MKLIRACWKSEQSGGGSCGIAKLCQPVVSIELRRVRFGRVLAGERYVLPRVHAPTESRGNFIVIKVQALTTPDHLNAETVCHF
jgi:hypothetical protein